MIVYQISVKLKHFGFESYFNGFNLHYIECNPIVDHHDIISVKLIMDLLRLAKNIFQRVQFTQCINDPLHSIGLRSHGIYPCYSGAAH